MMETNKVAANLITELLILLFFFSTFESINVSLHFKRFDISFDFPYDFDSFR